MNTILLNYERQVVKNVTIYKDGKEVSGSLFHDIIDTLTEYDFEIQYQEITYKGETYEMVVIDDKETGMFINLEIC